MFPAGGFSLARAWKKVYRGCGASSEFLDKEVPPMEHFLLNVIAAVVAGVIVAWIVKRFNR